MKYFLSGCLFWGIGACALYIVRPNARLNKKTVETADRKEFLMAILVIVATVLLCTLPMSLSPTWNGEIPGHRNQYEILAESILNGHINLDYGDMDPKLLEMENPYNPEQRKAMGVSYHWDHAFYNGQYYMYFGVVPVFLLFLPFRVITGTSLTTYHATQVFTALFILGIFALFLLLSKKFFSSLSWAAYLSLSAAASAMSVWYIVDAPALYCTAISAGICLEVWSLFFFANAVWESTNQRQSILYGVLGSLFGALAFGCRPPTALANILAIPMFLCYIKGKKFNRKLLKQILVVILPYIIIGTLLMVYNYARFENPFEFGQSYQLTVADQSSYGALSQFNLSKIRNGLLQNFISYSSLQDSFPYFSDQSVFLNFPICIIAYFFRLQKDSLSLLKRHKLIGFMVALVLLPGIITISQILMAPYLTRRCRVDIYWLMGLFSYFSFGLLGETLNNRFKKGYGFFLSLLSFATIFRCFLLWTIPHDSNFTNTYPQYLEMFEKVIWFGFR